MPAAPTSIISITDSVGEGGENLAADVLTVHARLSGLGFPVPAFPENPTEEQIRAMGTNAEFVHAVRLFQGVKNGLEKVGLPQNDGRVDPGGDTLAWLNAKNAPLWIMMPAGSNEGGYYNFEVSESTADHFDYGTSWLAQTLVDAGDHYFDAYRNSNTAPPITANDASIPKGGPAVKATDPTKLEHKGHQCGMSIDLRLPRTDGTAPGNTRTNRTGDNYSSTTMRAMLEALHAQPLFKNALLNDDELIQANLCSFADGHYDHAHINIKPPARIDLTPATEVFGQIANHTDEALAVYGPKRDGDPTPGPFSLWRLPAHQETPPGVSYEGVFIPNDRTASQWKYIDFLFSDTPGEVAIGYGAGLRVEVSMRDATRYALPPHRGAFPPDHPIGWHVPDWAHNGAEIAALPESPNVIRARTGGFYGRCSNLTNAELAVYGPKTVAGPTPNVLYRLASRRMTPRYWDCDGVFIPTDRTGTSPRTASIPGRRAVKYVDVQHFQVRASGMVYQLPFEAAIFDETNTVNWSVPDLNAAGVSTLPPVPDDEAPVPDGHGRCLNRTDETLVVYGPHREEDADDNLASLYRLLPGKETPDNWHFAGLYLPSDREARRVGVGMVSGPLAIVFPSGINMVIEKWNGRYTLPVDINAYGPAERCTDLGVPRLFLTWPNYGWPFCVQWPIPNLTFAQATDPSGAFPEVASAAPVGAPPRKRSGFERLDNLFYGDAAAPIQFADPDRVSVGEIQTLLRGHGHHRLPDQRTDSYGLFGPQTKAALLDFCAKHKVPCDAASPQVDRIVLKALVETPMGSPVFGPLMVSLKLGRAWDAWLKMIQLTTLFEGRGEFGRLNLGKEDKQGLSYGLIQWTQRSKRLRDEILHAFDKTNRKLFHSLFLGATRAAGLLTHTSKPRGGLNEDGTTSDANFDIVAPPWTDAFKSAAKETAFQIVQVDAAVAAYQKMYKRIQSDMPRIKSERGVCFALDLGNQAGPTGAVNIYDAVASTPASGDSEAQLLEAMADESVRRAKEQFKNGVRTRRDWFRTTTLLSDQSFDDLVRAAAPDRR